MIVSADKIFSNRLSHTQHRQALNNAFKRKVMGTEQY